MEPVLLPTFYIICIAYTSRVHRATPVWFKSSAHASPPPKAEPAGRRPPPPCDVHFAPLSAACFVQVFPSSGGKRLYTYGKGDDASSWAVVDFEVANYVSAPRCGLPRAVLRLAYRALLQACPALVVGFFVQGCRLREHAVPCCAVPCCVCLRQKPAARPAAFLLARLPLTSSQTVDKGVWFDAWSDLKSHPDDPMPLAPVTAQVRHRCRRRRQRCCRRSRRPRQRCSAGAACCSCCRRLLPLLLLSQLPAAAAAQQVQWPPPHCVLRPPPPLFLCFPAPPLCSGWLASQRTDVH